MVWQGSAGDCRPHADHVGTAIGILCRAAALESEEAPGAYCVYRYRLVKLAIYSGTAMGRSGVSSGVIQNPQVRQRLDHDLDRT